MRPTSLVVFSTTVIIGGMIVFNAFFGQHPGSSPRALVKLPAGEATHVSVEASGKSSPTLTLKYDELVEDVQRELLATGHFQGLVDGVDGPRTRIAVETYQRDNKLDETGDVSKQLLDHIRFLKKVAQANNFTGSIAALDAEELPPVKTIIEVPRPVKPKKLFFVEDEAVPPPVAKPKQVLKPVQKPVVAPEVVAKAKAKVVKPITVEIPVAAKPVEATPILKLQQRLAKLGYDPHSRSGQLDDATRSAILTFEMDKGLAMEGSVSKALLDAMKLAEQKRASQ